MALWGLLLWLWAAPSTPEIAARVRELLREAAPDARLDIDTVRLEGVAPPEGAEDFALRRLGQGKPGGTELFELDWLSGGRPVKKVSFRLRVHRYLMAAVACRDMLAREVLTDSLVCSEERAAIGAAERAVSADSAKGLRLRRPVGKGHMFLMGELEEVPLVLKGQEVRLVSAVGAAHVEVPAVALQDGAAGRHVRVRTALGREVVGRVEMDGTVNAAPGARAP